jgi:Skp family chaperone for outer membrane proteins
MGKSAKVLLWSALILVSSLGIAQAADKFASVDIMRIASEYNKAKDYNKSIESKATAVDVEIEKKVKDIKQLQDKIGLLSDKEKEAKRPEYENKIKDLQEFRRQKEMDLRKLDLDNSKILADDIRGAITQYATKEGITIVFDDRSMIYQAKGYDITDKVVDILNKGYKK